MISAWGIDHGGEVSKASRKPPSRKEQAARLGGTIGGTALGIGAGVAATRAPGARRLAAEGYKLSRSVGRNPIGAARNAVATSGPAWRKPNRYGFGVMGGYVGGIYGALGGATMTDSEIKRYRYKQSRKSSNI